MMHIVFLIVHTVCLFTFCYALLFTIPVHMIVVMSESAKERRHKEQMEAMRRREGRLLPPRARRPQSRPPPRYRQGSQR